MNDIAEILRETLFSQLNPDETPNIVDAVHYAGDRIAGAIYELAEAVREHGEQNKGLK